MVVRFELETVIVTWDWSKMKVKPVGGSAIPHAEPLKVKARRSYEVAPTPG